MSENLVRIDSSNLKPLMLKPTIPGYIADLWNRRHFIWADAMGKSFRTTRDYALWRLWLILVPIFNIAVYAFVFGFILNVSRGIPSFLSFLTIGVIFFSFMQTALTASVNLIQVNRHLIGAFNFPRAAVVVSHSIRYSLDHLIPAIIAVVFAVLLKDHITISWTILLVIPIYVLIHLFGLGLSFFIARLSAFRPETQVAVKVLSQAWFFVSGVFFSVERFVDHHFVQAVMVNNPAYAFLSAVRECVVYDSVPSPQLWIQITAWSFGLLFLGLIFFWRAEERYAGIQ